LADVTLDRLCAACAGRIARFKHPQHLDLVDALPRNATGKVILTAVQVAAPGVHMLNPMPLFHAGGLNVLANPILMHGGRVTTMSRWDPAAILAYIDEQANAVTHLTTAPSLLQSLVEDPGFADANFSTIRKMVIGGGATNPGLLHAFAAKGVELHPQYGGTETGPAALVLEEGIERALTGSCGKPVLHTAVRLVDPDTLTDVPDCVVGEIWLKGPAVTPGYWKLPNEQHFVDGWFVLATPPAATPTATTTSRGATKTCTNPVARTSTRPRSRTF
jgi:fatty-acyl-CoA synthase